jgi:outer membrane murein-binding lipoprotein Lpp
MSQHYAPTPVVYGRKRPNQRTPWLVGAAVVVVVGIAGCIAGATLLDNNAKTSTETLKAQQAQALADVKLTKCGVDTGTGWPKATLAIVNHGADKASYLITVAFQSDDGATQYDSAPTSVQDLSPGQQAATVAEGLAAAPRTFTCEIVSVHRM